MLIAFLNGINTLFIFHFTGGSYTIMWRRAEGDPNNYLVLGKNIMDRNQAGRMTVELVNDEDIDGPGKIIDILDVILLCMIYKVELMKRLFFQFSIILY